MELKQFKQKLDPLITEFLDKKIKNLPQFTNQEIDSYFLHLKKFLIEGKRIRPYLAYLAYKANCEESDDKAIKLLMFIEIFHAFCLVHDDIMDKSSHRHNEKTTHEFIRDLNKSNKFVDPKHFGNSQAILIGDYLLSWAFEILINNQDFDKKTIERVTKIFFEMIDEVFLGQMIDLNITKEEKVTDEIIYQKILLKTAGYSFIKPLLIGASLSGEVKDKTFFEEFGKHLGTAFQIQDDLLDIKYDSSQTNKSSFTDILEHNHTLFTNYIFKHGTAEQKEILNKHFGKTVASDQANLLRKVFVDSGAVEYGEKIINENLNTARRILEDQKMDEEYKTMFEKLIEKMEGRTS